ATEMTTPPAKPAADDPGPPKLQRGKPADSAREHAPAPPADAPAATPAANPVAANLPPPAVDRPALPPSETAAPSEPSIVRGDEDTVPSFLRSDDPLIRKA